MLREVQELQEEAVKREILPLPKNNKKPIPAAAVHSSSPGAKSSINFEMSHHITTVKAPEPTLHNARLRAIRQIVRAKSSTPKRKRA